MPRSRESEESVIDGPDAFRIFGFADFGVNHAWLGRRSFLKNLAAEETTFTLGNLNLYFDFHPDPAWQVLAEIRFSAYPHGNETAFSSPVGGEYLRTDTTVRDVTSPATGRTFRWGSTFIERAYAQWTHSEKLSLRVGQFLTPYGVWNVDHATTTLIGLMVPHFAAAEIMPARQLGIEVFGAFMRESWELGYDLYVSNGRTTTQIDLTEDKAFGGRLKATRLGKMPFVLGGSFYYGTLNDVSKSISSFEPFHISRTLTVEGTEWSVGADVSLDVSALRLRAEFLTRQTRYEEGKRPPLTFGRPDAYKPDNNEYDSYLLAAYRLPWLGLEPFLYGEYDHFVSIIGDDQVVASVGLNIHFTPFAQLKTQVARVYFFDLDAGDYSNNNMTLLFSRLAIAF